MKEGKLRKSRSATRGWMTHSSNALMDLLGDRELSKVELQDAVDDFDRRLAHLDEVQSVLELEIGDSQDLEEDIEYADKFRRQVRVPRIQAAQRLLALEKLEKPPNESGSADSLDQFTDELLTHVRSLEALGVDGNQYRVFMAPVILSRLPPDIRLGWSREGSGHERDLDWLLNFLQREIEHRERSDTFKDINAVKTDNHSVESEKRSKFQGSASALQTTSEVSFYKCMFCGKNHKSENCFGILKLSIAEREEAIRSAKLCFRCLEKGRMSRGCQSKCIKCKGKHNVLCCTGNKTKVYNKNDQNVSGAMSQDSINENVTHCEPNLNNRVLTQSRSVLQTAKVKVLGKKGICEATLLFDTGADRSYVSSKFVKRVRSKWITSEFISFSSFGGGKASKSNQCNVYVMSLVGYKGESHSLMAAEIPDICAPLFRPSVPDEEVIALSKLQLADDYMNNRHANVDILVGLNAYWRFMVPNKTVQSKNLVAQESEFGWVLSGSCNIPLDRVSVTSQLLCINNVSESDLHKFWDLEYVGIFSKEAVSNEFSSSTVLQKSSDNVKFIDGRYEVSLPWKSDVAKQSLKNNEKLARKRLENLNVKFVKTPGLREGYDEVFEEYEKDDIIEEVPHSEISSVYPVYYLLHRPVIRESSNATKVRPVFDASAVSYNGISLNDCLECGPSLNPDLVEVLIRFRRWNVALTADITKAFLQIKVQREDQDVHRFLWQNKGIVRVMRFVRVPFGNKSIPFLLNATIKHHLKSYPNSEVVEELNSNLYVDDWLSGADSITEACVKFDKACKIMSEAGMSLSKWNSNGKSLTGKFNANPNDCRGNKSIKILGMRWVSTHDYFSFCEVNVGSQIGVVSTKRSVLSLIARCFDPLGLISPFVMFAKILFQDVRRVGLKWDDVLPEELHCKFQRWLRGFEKLGSWKVQRCYFEDLSWKDLTGLELHSFRDVSEKGYGACVYLRVPLQDGSFKASLVMSRGRLEYSDLCYESKHPIILPSTHIVKTLVRFQQVLLKHSGASTLVSTLRNGYWIVRLRRIAKTLCREFVTCRRYDSKACSQPVAPLPELKVKPAPPFSVTGLDFAGSLFCVDLPSKKLYILLFTCAVIRSVHLELTDSLSMPDYLLAIRRFTARRGLPSIFYSDNAKTFVGVSQLLQQHYGLLAPQWKFIVPRAPW
ncbi:uncharacterized protein [Macrobrachium rosenbergii]|uniref:uncharacterized protein n=1 Tax=Macrobrachium rosenbergii TaxID=79674 RepID=UPI0034D442B7